MRYLAILLGLTLVSVIPVAPHTALQNEDTFTFTNNTGGDVHDLHIDWSRAVKVKKDEPFAKTSGSGTNKTAHSKGTVKNGKTATVTVTWDGSDPKVRKWWWTDANGKRVGKVHGGNPTTVSTHTGRGLDTATFVTPYGNLTVNLPDDMAAGDTISGTVVPQPNGDTSDEIQQNSDTLSGYVVEVARTETPGDGGSFKWEIPIGTAITTIILRNPEGNPAGTAQIPHDPIPLPSPTDPPTPGDFDLPDWGQQGKPFEIPGQFDGDGGNTGLTIGEQQSPILAESPRKAVAFCPAGASGTTDIKLSEGDVEATGSFNRLNVQLSAGKLSMIKGESTTVTALIAGLGGLPDSAFPIPFQLANFSYPTVDFTGGDSVEGVISHEITASEVGADGTYTYSVGLLAQSAGSFQIGCELGKFNATCGAQTHVLLITRLSKNRKGRQHCVKWTETCHLGTCRLKAGHAGDHVYSYKKCRTHAADEHEDCYNTRSERDARYRELQKEKEKREADAGY